MILIRVEGKIEFLAVGVYGMKRNLIWVVVGLTFLVGLAGCEEEPVVELDGFEVVASPVIPQTTAAPVTEVVTGVTVVPEEEVTTVSVEITEVIGVTDGPETTVVVEILEVELPTDAPVTEALTVPVVTEPIPTDAPVVELPVETLPPTVPTLGVHPSAAMFATELLAMINAQRIQVGAGVLSMNGNLESLAAIQVVDMSAVDVLSHNRSGTILAQMNEVTASGTQVNGSNASMQWRTWTPTTTELAQAVFDGWMNSPGHRDNMLAAHTAVGISMAQAASGNYYFYAFFGH